VTFGVHPLHHRVVVRLLLVTGNVREADFQAMERTPHVADWRWDAINYKRMNKYRPPPEDRVSIDGAVTAPANGTGRRGPIRKLPSHPSPCI
jgi:hypothetical protein